jgi:phosphonate transport system substrate-binding protein
LLWRTDLPAHLKREIRSFFINYGRPAPNKTPDQVEQEQRVLQRSGKSRFVPSNNNQLIPVRRLELFRNRLLVEGNTAITPEARLKRLADIDRQLDMLD